MIKVVLDQGIGAPLYIYSYYIITHFMQSQLGSSSNSGGGSGSATKEEPLIITNKNKNEQKDIEQEEEVTQNNSPLTALKDTHKRATEMLLPTMMQHWKVWPLVHTFNFYYIPLHHRVLVQNTLLIGWSGYLSHLNNGGLMTPHEEVEVAIKRRNTSIIRERSAKALDTEKAENTVHQTSRSTASNSTDNKR
eukprot:CAMPEP_0170760484 /NCGR_PEP_ID=MMETSP0733-20121128/1578_1 /TAXON_ID=186038 /ORGANISM="Fragilariopsis kerguelensis, Strain L26-C5" /LENGTH=191 /DNA_ID=CAMNT_0011100235 /DNA_START=30 /DNA_END=605 /DNA_ORIENTATION=+